MCYTTVYRGINSLTLTYTTRDSCITYKKIILFAFQRCHTLAVDRTTKKTLLQVIYLAAQCSALSRDLPLVTFMIVQFLTPFNRCINPLIYLYAFPLTVVSLRRHTTDAMLLVHVVESTIGCVSYIRIYLCYFCFR